MYNPTYALSSKVSLWMLYNDGLISSLLSFITPTGSKTFIRPSFSKIVSGVGFFNGFTFGLLSVFRDQEKPSAGTM